LKEEGAAERKEYELLKRVFEEQYEIKEGGVKARRVIKKGDKDKDDGSGTRGSQKVQSPHDSECEYREKGEQRVKGYSINITETCDKEGLNLIVDVQTKGATAVDSGYLQEAIEGAQEIVAGEIKEAYTDGAYHSPENEKYCEDKDIELILRGISGKPSKYDLSYDERGELVVINKENGCRLEAMRTKTRDPNAPVRWRVKDGEHAPIYFEDEDVVVCELRKRLANIPVDKLNIRNNVEATIFQLGYHFRRNKTRYRGKIKHHIWALARCMWINFRRIRKWMLDTLDKGGQEITDTLKNLILSLFSRFNSPLCPSPIPCFA
jgi:hypothetical protein